MARRRYHRGRRGGLHIGRWVNLAFKVMGGVAIAGPAIAEIQADYQSPQKIPSGLVYHYTGFNPGNPSGGIDTGMLTGAVASVAGGLVLMKIGGLLGKHFR